MALRPLIVLMVFGRKATFDEVEGRGSSVRVQELCESRGGRPGLPVPNSPYGFCGRKETVHLNLLWILCKRDSNFCVRDTPSQEKRRELQ